MNAWVAKTKERQLAAFRLSAQRLIEIAQTPISEGGNLPTDTTFMRSTLKASLDGSLPALVERPAGIKHFTYDEGEVNLVIANATLTDKITVGYGANYAVYQEYGSQGRAGRRFVGLAVQQWARVVGEVCTELESRAK